MGQTLPLFTMTFNRGLAIEGRPERLPATPGRYCCGRPWNAPASYTGWSAGSPTRGGQISSPARWMRCRAVPALFGQGLRDQDDADALRFAPALRLAVAGERGTTPLEDGRHLPSQLTLSRLLDILSTDANRRVLREAITELTGRRLRAGNAHTADGALGFILHLVDRAKTALCQIAMMRLDAGFPDDTLLSDLEARGTPYVARLRNNKALDRMTAPQNHTRIQWLNLAPAAPASDLVNYPG